MKKHKNYIITAIIAFVIFAIICAIKGFYPFGKDYIIWGDLHSQITTMYYYFYDAVVGDKSLFINFFNGGGVNFFGIFAYYISSPFTFITLLFPRDMIMHSVTLILGLKIMLSSVTCLYLINSWFKKIDKKYAILLSIIYAFSSYSLIMNIIPAYLDTVYLLPLLMVGLKKMLDGKGVKQYIIFLTLSLITNFYLSIMLLLIIAMLSIIYIKVFNNDNRKSVVARLGISTIIAVMISGVILLPTISEILSSSRISLNFKTIFNSGLGPISDKVLFFVTLGLPIASVLLLAVKKGSKQFLKLIIPVLILLCIPVLVEPINKMMHLGSYVCYPYRYGFISMLMFIVSGAYFFNKKEQGDNKSPLPMIITVVSSLLLIFLSYKYFGSIQKAVDRLSFSYDKKILLVMILMFFITLVSYLIILKKNNKKTWVYVSVIATVTILTNSLFYFGINFDQKNLQNTYNSMLYLYENKDDGYRLKVPDSEFIENISMVSDFNSIGHFTSLINKNASVTFQKLGYDTFWLNTLSSGSNIFIDNILSHKYMFSKTPGHFYEKIGDNFYKTTLNPSYVYLIKDNAQLIDYENTFINTNKIYKSFGNDDNIFEIIDNFELHNLKFENNKFEIIDKEQEAYFTKKINITREKILYFEANNSYENYPKQKMYRSFDIYVNDKLLFEKYPNKKAINTIDLGVFDDETITLKVIVRKNVKLNYIAFGLLDTSKLKGFYKESNGIKIDYIKNKIKVTYDGEEEGIIFIPINNLEGMKAKINGKSAEIINVYGNFIGVKVDGKSDIVISYIPKWLYFGVVTSIIGLILGIVYSKCYQKINIFKNFIYIVYLLIISALFIAIYLIPLFMFIKSFIS